MKSKEAIKIGRMLKDQLEPHCDRIEFCGPLRRGGLEVKNIQLIVTPKKQIVPITKKVKGIDLLENVELPVEEFAKVLSQYKTIVGNISGGGKAQQLYLPKYDAKLDLFTAEPRNWGYLLMCRTGSEDFFRKTMLKKLKTKGFKCKGGYIWRKTELIETPEETDVFALMETKYLSPDQRN
jgi:DNA polymerase/3'-5' exonuclease PolX